MKILEIKNNLVKLAYSDSEAPVLGKFLVLATDDKAYVAQFVNLKSDTVNSYAIAKLLFTFNKEGVVDNYDGSIPSVNSQVSFLPSGELLQLLPMETPIKMGMLSQQEDMLEVDISVFERNFTVFAEKDFHKITFISNCVRQLFRQKEKSVIVDNCNLFEDYPKIKLGQDFKLPLNAEFMDYIFEHDLSEVEASTKAIIQDIFYEVQQYIKTLDEEFLPIEKFVDVVTAQYKTTQMPELALLKNKLLKYRDAGVFADAKDEIKALEEKLNSKNCIILDIKDECDSLQKELVSYLHKILNKSDQYIYLFLPLTDDISDKKLLTQILNHNHVFTTFLVSSSYKYAEELKQHAQNLVLFTPESATHSFASYNTFLNKLNPNECIVEGNLTQGIPFIIDMEDLDVDLTKEDVLGDRCQFIPVTQEETQLVRINDLGVAEPVEEKIEQPAPEPEEEVEELPKIEDSAIVLPPSDVIVEEDNGINQNIVQPINNIMEEQEPADEVEEDLGFEEPLEEEPNEEDLFIDEELTEDDLNFIEENQMIEESENYEETPPVVPVYPVEDETVVESVEGFAQGDSVSHPRYGRGIVEKIIKYGNKTLCSISFENVGRRLLDPTISELTKA
jgi:hypothetical protein